MYFASRVISSASRTTSFGIVAEKSSVWRTAGIAVMMRRTSGQQPMQRRDDERCGFARAGLGAGDQVVVGERERDDGGLDGARILPAQVTGAFEQPLVESQRRERDGSGVDVDRMKKSRPARRGRA